MFNVTHTKNEIKQINKQQTKNTVRIQSILLKKTNPVNTCLAQSTKTGFGFPMFNFFSKFP